MDLAPVIATNFMCYNVFLIFLRFEQEASGHCFDKRTDILNKQCFKKIIKI